MRDPRDVERRARRAGKPAKKDAIRDTKIRKLRSTGVEMREGVQKAINQMFFE